MAMGTRFLMACLLNRKVEVPHIFHTGDIPQRKTVNARRGVTRFPAFLQIKLPLDEIRTDTE